MQILINSHVKNAKEPSHIEEPTIDDPLAQRQQPILKIIPIVGNQPTSS